MKYFVCIPRGGIADIFNVIGNCLDYCVKYNRILVIYNKGDWIEGDIQKYITFTHENIYKGDVTDKIRVLENMSIFPNEIKNIENIKSVYFKNKNNNRGYHICSDTKDNEFIFGHTDLSKDYEENVVVYLNCYGGVNENIFNYIKFTNIVLDVYYKRLLCLKDDYISIHVRNTDAITENLDEFLNTINNEIENNDCVFLASDNKKNIDHIRNKYGKKIYTFSNITYNNGGNMHYRYDKKILTNEEVVIDCLVDLLLLSNGKQLFYSCNCSNYSLVANYLLNHKDVLNKLIK